MDRMQVHCMLRRLLRRFTQRRDSFSELEARLNYRFANRDFLLEAVTHRSYARGVRNDEVDSYERMEFLGDSVLGLVVTAHLYRRYRGQREGNLTKIKATLVNERSLSQVARQLGLGEFILLSPEEEQGGGRHRKSILADACEALFGAVYLDSGMKEASKLVHRLILSQMDRFLADRSQINYKGELLEHYQSMGKGMPRYEMTSEVGSDHDKVFAVQVKLEGVVIGRGQGKSKKAAEQEAARAALDHLELEPRKLGSDPGRQFAHPGEDQPED
jgi:ribonuclease-3